MTSAFLARSVRPRRARPTRASRPDSSAAGDRALPRRRAAISVNRRILAAMRSKSAALIAPLDVVVRGTSALASHAKTRDWPMNAINRSEQLESIDADTDLVLASEVEAGIRDFVRND